MLTSGLVAAVGTATVLTVGAPGPALAADPPTPARGKTVEMIAGVGWLEEDREDASGRAGNVHLVAVGFTTNGEVSDLFAGLLIDYDCSPGDLPTDAGADCRQLVHYEAATAKVRFTFDPRAGTAQATGTVDFSDVLGQEPEQLTLPVHLRWTAEGKPVRTVSHHKDLSKALKQVIHVRTVTWPTIQVSGTVGSFVAGDELGEINFRQLTHERTQVFFLSRPTGAERTNNSGMG